MKTMKDQIIEKIKNKDIIIGIMGLGYVGLPLAVEVSLSGFKVIGFDVQNDKVEKINKGISYIGDVDDIRLSTAVRDFGFRATVDFNLLHQVDYIIIAVPTPLDKYKQPDMVYIENSAYEIGKRLGKNKVVVLESTTYPGTTEELVMPILEHGSGLKCGTDFYLGFSPERVDPGNRQYSTVNTPKVVGGVGCDATEVIASMYRQVLKSEVLEVSSPKVAEMEKLLENTYRHVNIGLANETAIICNIMGINVWEVIEAAKTKPYGFQAFYPGPGLGGHCIPLDPYYLVWKAKEFDYHAKLVEASGIINDFMPEYVVNRAGAILNKHKKPLNGSKVLVLGVAYKQDINDYRESPAIKVIEQFKKNGSIVCFYDPYIPQYHHEGKFFAGIEDITDQILEDMDIIVIVTAHSNLDYSYIQKHAAAIFDTKNVMKYVTPRHNVEVL